MIVIYAFPAFAGKAFSIFDTPYMPNIVIYCVLQPTQFKNLHNWQKSTF